MDESQILAVSISQAVEADAAILEEYRREDQITRARMLAQALEENRQVTIEPLNDQPALDDETLNSFRLLNIAAPDGSGSSPEGSEEIEELVAEFFESVGAAQHAGGTGDTQQNEYNSDSTEDTGVYHEVEPLRQQPEVASVHPWVDLPASYFDGWVRIPDRRDRAPEFKRCMVCQNEYPERDTQQAHCGCIWCRNCLVAKVELSIKYDSHFPPECCEPSTLWIELENPLIPQSLYNRFSAKEVEFKTTDRTYCSDKSCSTFITPRSIERAEGIAHCSRCKKRTCTSCKQDWHEGICPVEEESQLVLRLAEQEGWRRCGNCQHLIELTYGCYHMTCNCGHQFCYLCGTRWKNCGCVQQDEDGLLDTEDDASDTEDEGPWHEVPEGMMVGFRLPPALRQDNPRETQDEYAERARRQAEREAHYPDCQHERWGYSFGDNQCDGCGHVLRVIISTCQNCQKNACRQCR